MAATLNPKPTTIALLTARDAFSIEVSQGVKDYGTISRHAGGLQQGVSGRCARPKRAGQSGGSGQPRHPVELRPLCRVGCHHNASKQFHLNAKIAAYSSVHLLLTSSTTSTRMRTTSMTVRSGPQVKYTPSFYLSVADYVKAYKAKFSTTDDPDYHVAESTAACLAFQKALENAGSLDPSKVRDALASLDVMTFFGQIKFDSRGLNTFKPMVVEQIQNGTHYTVFPASVANGRPQYPDAALELALGQRSSASELSS